MIVTVDIVTWAPYSESGGGGVVVDDWEKGVAMSPWKR